MLKKILLTYTYPPFLFFYFVFNTLTLFCVTNVYALTITGSIKNPQSFGANGQIIPYVISFQKNNLIYNNLEYATVPQGADGTFSLEITLEQPSEFLIKYHQLQTVVFLMPNQNLHITLDANGIDHNPQQVIKTITYSDRGSYNNFCAELQRQFLENPQVLKQLASLRQQYSITNYQKYCQDLQKKEEGLLSAYLEKYSTAPINFKEWASNTIKYRYANRISEFYFAVYNKKEDGYANFIQKYTFKNTDLLNCNEYLQFIQNHMRQSVLRQYVADTLLQQKRQHWLITAYQLTYQLFEENITRNHAKAIILIKLIEKEQISAQTTFDDFIKNYNNDNSNISNSILQYVTKRYEDIKNTIDPPPTAARTNPENTVAAPETQSQNAPPIPTQLYNLYATPTITFQDILQKYEGSVIYMDIWASWCPPCLASMPKAKELQAQLNNPNIKWVYISLDENEDAWKGILNKFQLVGEHYFATRALHTELEQRLGVTALPHYFIFDKKGSIAAYNAPAPEHAEQLKLMITKWLND